MLEPNLIWISSNSTALLSHPIDLLSDQNSMNCWEDKISNQQVTTDLLKNLAKKYRKELNTFGEKKNIKKAGGKYFIRYDG